jgi:hypothetical protein
MVARVNLRCRPVTIPLPRRHQLRSLLPLPAHLHPTSARCRQCCASEGGEPVIVGLFLGLFSLYTRKTLKQKCATHGNNAWRGAPVCDVWSRTRRACTLLAKRPPRPCAAPVVRSVAPPRPRHTHTQHTHTHTQGVLSRLCLVQQTAHPLNVNHQ